MRCFSWTAPIRRPRRCRTFDGILRLLRVRSSALCVTLLGLTSSAGFAAEPGAPLDAGVEPPAPGAERVVELNEQGNALYASGDYRRAAELFLQAHAIDEDPNLLFNIGSCYEALGDIDAALEKYRAFLASPDADPEGR